MIRKIIIFLFLGNFIFASANYELKLYEKVLPIVLTNTKIVVYADEQSKEILKDSHIFELSDDCSKASLLIGKDFQNLKKECSSKPIFATSYRSFKDLNNSFGAFYWRKGRPQIKFNRSRIETLELYLPNSLSKYATE